MRNKQQTYSTRLVLLLFVLIVIPSVQAESVPPMDVPYYSQNVDVWANEHLGSNPFFVRDAGCALTSTAMVFAYYGLDVDPSILNKWLTTHDGYDEQGSVRWKTAAEISTTGNTQTITLDETNDVKIWASTRDSPVLADLAVINHYLRSGYPILAQVWYSDFNYGGGWHWVVLTGYSTIDNWTMYTIHDPYIDSVNINGLSAVTIPDPRFYERQNGGASGTIFGIVVFRRMPEEPGSTAGDDLSLWPADDVSPVNRMVIPWVSPPSIPCEGTFIPPLNQEIIPQYTGLIGPGTGEDIYPAAGPIPIPEAETEDKTPERDAGGEDNPATNRIPQTALDPIGYSSLMVPDLPAHASGADAGSGPVISFPRLPILFPL